MTEETNTGVPEAPSIPSDIYTPFDPTENDVETIPAGADDHADKDVKQPRLNAAVAPNSPQAYDDPADDSPQASDDETDGSSQAPDDRPGDSDRPAPRIPGTHAFDRGFEYDDEDAA